MLGTTASVTSASTDTATTTGTATITDTATTTDKTTTGTNPKTTATTSISINPAAGAGGISMITPAATATTYYKIGQDVTFVWNYTSLSVTPSAVNVVASCSLNSATYTLTQNMSVDPTGTMIWDTGKFQASATMKLLTATYTLFVYDASKSLEAIAQAGYLSGQIGYSFGMYIPQSYTPLNRKSSHQAMPVLSVSLTSSEFHCATCNGALSDIQRQGLKFAVGMAAITIASFTWFVGGLGIFST